MEAVSLMKCPVCNLDVKRVLFQLDVPELFLSKLYESIIVLKCDSCNHIFNKISALEYEGILSATNLNASGLKRVSAIAQQSKGRVAKPVSSDYLDKQDLRSQDKSSSDFSKNLTHERAQQTSEYILLHSNPNDKVLDIGCGKGGLLNYLSSMGYSNLYGIDRDTASIVEAKKAVETAIFFVGEAEKIPFKDSSFDLIVLDQVLEHLRWPLNAISEIFRVLKDDGKLVIGVPDVDRYDKHYFFEHYWFLMKGHIQHFGEQSLGNLLSKESFELKDSKKVLTVLNSSMMTMPNLISLFEKRSREQNIEVQQLSKVDRFNIDSYLKDNRTRGTYIRQTIDKAVFSGKLLYCWGLSREFQYLMSNSNLYRANIKEIIDSDEFIDSDSQDYKFDFPIRTPHFFGSGSSEELLLITATAHSVDIRSRAKRLGFQGEIISLR
jgi:ubiquinone/menaquinone biosynthesis C-methylase UbiE